MKTGIYKIINKIDDRYYVGRSLNIFGRIRLHFKLLSEGKHFNYKLQRAYNQFGRENFRWEIVENCLVEEVSEREQTFLDECKSFPESNYNISYTSESIDVSNEEIRKRISVANKGRKFTEEHKLKISLALKGIKRNPISNETRLKMSKAHKGKLIGKLNPMFGKRFSDEQKEKWSDMRRGELNSNFGGKYMTENIRDKISNTLKRKHRSGAIKIHRSSESIDKVSGINNYSSDKTIYTFYNTVTKEIYLGYRIEFKKKYNLNPNCLSAMIRGKQSHTKNWVLKQKEPPLSDGSLRSDFNRVG
jgi:hypothetical protein